MSFAIPRAVAALLTLLAAVPVSAVEPPSGTLVALAPTPNSPGIRVVAASGAVKIKGGAKIAAGTVLGDGETVQTGRSGKLLVAFDDGTRVRLGGDTEASISQSPVTGIAISLARGRVAARTAGPLKVRTHDFAATAAGGAFSATLSRWTLEVAVSAGKVNVERPNALPMLVDSGSFIVFSARSTKATKAELSAQKLAEIAQVDAVVETQGEQEPSEWAGFDGAAPAPTPRTVGLQAGAVNAQPAPLPEPAMRPPELDGMPPPESLASAPPALLVAAEPEPRPEPRLAAAAPATTSDFDAPPRPAPQVQTDPSAEQSPVATPAPIAAPTPSPRSAGLQSGAVGVQPAPRARVEELQEGELEELFLLRAERSLRKGGCLRFAAGLEEIASDQPSNESSERARIMRARCFAREGRPELAQAEYRRYLQEIPNGRFAALAQQAVDGSK